MGARFAEEEAGTRTDLPFAGAPTPLGAPRSRAISGVELTEREAPSRTRRPVVPLRGAVVEVVVASSRPDPRREEAVSEDRPSTPPVSADRPKLEVLWWDGDEWRKCE